MSEDNGKKLVLIVGMHRSGTSAIGRLLSAMGCDFGSNLMEGIKTINNDGFWEDREVVALNEHIFSLFQSNWYDFERLPGKWWEDEKIKELLGVAENWYRESFSGDSVIAIKDPRFCRLLPFWKRVFHNVDAHVLFVVRDPLEVAVSLQKRDGFVLEVGYLLWLIYTIDGLYYSRNMDMTLTNYADLMSDPRGAAQVLLQAGLADSPGDSDNLDELVAAVIDPEQYRNKRKALEQDQTIDPETDIKQLAHELYEVLASATVDEAKAVADKYRKRLYRLLDRHSEVLSALRHSVVAQVALNRKLSEIGGSHSYALSTVEDKDRQLDDNKSYIEQCENRIREQDALLEQLGAKAEQLENFEKAVTDREEKLSDNISYIEQCEKRIAEQDHLLAELGGKLEALEHLEQVVADREEKLQGNIVYIEQCEKRINEQDSLLSELGSKAEQLENMDKALADRESKLSENQGYIAECEARIREQDNLLAGLGSKVEQLENLERALEDREGKLSENQAYIDECEGRIRDQDELLAELGRKVERLDNIEKALEDRESKLEENIAYIEKCETRLQQQDKGLDNLQRMLDESSNYVKTCETRIQEQDEQMLGLGQKAERLELVEKALTEKDELLAGLGKKAERLELVEKALTEKDELLAGLGKKAERLELVEKALTEKDELLAGLGKKAERLELVEKVLLEKDEQLQQGNHTINDLMSQVKNLRRGAEENTDYIEICQQRIAELDLDVARLAEERAAFEKEIIAQRKLDELHHQRVSLQKQQINRLKEMLIRHEAELRGQLQENDRKADKIEWYRSYAVVKLIDKLFYKEDVK